MASEYANLAAGAGVGESLSDAAWYAAIISFESALARAAAACGYVDQPAADDALATIAEYTAEYTAEYDQAALSARAAAGGNPAIPLVEDLRAAARAAGRSAEAVHVGATSQDAVDTALVIIARAACAGIDAHARRITELLTALAGTHRGTAVMGRTLGQQALPTSFGLVAAGWLQGVAEPAGELRQAAAALPLQFAGATGNLAGTGIDLHDALAAELGLPARPLVWHSDRQPIARLAAAAARLAGGARKVAGDIVWYSATEVGELREAHPGGSSAMPHKANPAAAVAADGYARRTPGLAATLLDALDCRLQRGVGSWHAEWEALRDLLAATEAALARLAASLDGLVVDAAAMAARCGERPDLGAAGALIDDILTRNTPQ